MNVRFYSGRRTRLWWLPSIGLAAPAAWPYITHYLFGHAGSTPTGFIKYDMPYYMADAREYFDGGGLTYGNPMSPSYDTPAIYFQPLTLFLGIVWRLTAADPGTVFVCVGAIAAIGCTRVAISLYNEVAGQNTLPSRLGLVAFVWGGGLLALAGIGSRLIRGYGDIFRFDPQNGWWCLNFGRTLVYPTEAFYHAVWFGSILLVIRGRFALALALAFVLSISHPFTGLELLAILCTWSWLERYFVESSDVPWSFFIGCCSILVFHLAYYIVFLNQFPEHRLLFEQWKLPTLLQFENFFPADVLAGGLAAWSLRRLTLARTFFSVRYNRLFLVWFLVAFALAHHEFAIAPIQPIHFDRGYVWIPLYLMGVPALLRLLDFLRSRLARALAVLSIVTVMALLVSDNLLWLGSFTRQNDQGFRLTGDEKALFEWLNAAENRGFVVLSQSGRIAYLATTYTPLRSWYSHFANTPDFERRRREAEAFFRDGEFLERWQSARLLIVREHTSESAATLPQANRGEQVFANATFTVVRHDPAPSAR